jgi:hypothetical protein
MKKKSELSKHLAKLGRKGGKTTAKKRTAAQRKASARKAARARWAKWRKAQRGMAPTKAPTK